MYLYVYIQYATIYSKIKFKIVCFSMGVHMYIFPDFYGNSQRFQLAGRVLLALWHQGPLVSGRMGLGLHEFCMNVGNCNLLDQLKFKLPALQRFLIIHFTSAFYLVGNENFYSLAILKHTCTLSSLSLNLEQKNCHPGKNN